MKEIAELREKLRKLEDHIRQIIKVNEAFKQANASLTEAYKKKCADCTCETKPRVTL